jgi:ribosomal protein L2
MASRRFKPTSPGGASTRSPTSRTSRRRPRRRSSPSTRPPRAVATTRAASRRASAAAATSSATAHRLEAQQDRRPGDGRDDRVRSQPHGAHRAAPLRRRREGLHPRARRPQGRATVRREPQRRHQAGQRAALRFIPLGTMIHNVELKIGKGGQLVRSAGVGRAAHGEGRRVRAGPPALGRDPQGAPRLPRHHRSGVEPEHARVTPRQGRAHRWLGRRPHNRGVTMNPVDHPMGGGEGRTSGGRHPCSPWGQLSKGLKTRTTSAPTS